MNDMTVVGNLTGDPVVSTTGTGKVRARFSVAVNKNYTDQYGSVKERTEFIDCVAWGKLAEEIGNYMCKGKRFVGVGEWESYSYDDQQGGKRRAKFIRIIDGGISFFSMGQKTNNYAERGRQSVPQQNAPAPSNEPPAGFAGFGQAVPPMDDIPY